MNTEHQPAADIEFWLRSIEDLDEQHTAGELSTATYTRLRDDYTSHAAVRLRDTATNPSPHATTETPARSRRRASMVVIGALAIVTIAALAIVPTSIRNRSAGETITGNAATVPSGRTVAQLQAVVDADPANPTAQLSLARALLEANQLVDAMTAYDVAEQLDPTNAEPAAYRAWIMLVAGLTAESRIEAERAIGIDADYPDAHLILTLVLRELGETASAATEVRAFLDLTDSDHPMRPMAEALVAALETDDVKTTIPDE